MEQAAALGGPITDAARELGGLGPAAGSELPGAHWDTVVRQRDERWHAEHRSAWAVGHAVRRSLRGDAGGVAQLRACIPGARFLSAEQARQNTVLLQRARQRHALAAEAVMQQWAAGTLAAAALTPSQAAALHAGVAAQPGVREAWCFGGQASVGEQCYPACLLVVRLDTWAAPGVLADEGGVQAQLQALLGWVVPARWLMLAHTCLTTEAPDPGLERAIAAAPQARLLPG